MQRTGHRSVAGVRAYKVPSEDMLKQVSNCLQPPSNDISPASLNAQSLHATSSRISSTDCASSCLQQSNGSYSGPIYNNCVYNFNK